MAGQEGRWPVIVGLGIVQILAWGCSFYLLSVLAAPIVADTGWPFPWVIGGISVGLFTAGMVSPCVGQAIALKGGRPVLSLSSCLLAAGLALLGAAINLPMFFAAWVVLGTGMGAGLYDAAFATLGRLYGATARTTITLLTLLGGFASTLCWPLAALLLEQVGWRGTCFIFALIQMVISLPLVLFTVPPAPEAGHPQGMTPARSLSLASEERAAFLIFAAILSIGSTVMTLLAVHLITLLRAHGMDLGIAVGLGALIGPSQVGSRVVEMAGRSRHHPIWTLIVAATFVLIGIVMLTTGYVSAALAIILYGGGNGLYTISRGTLPLALFGPARYPLLMGRLARPALVAQALAPSLGAFVITRWGASAAFDLLTGLAILNIGLVAALWVFSRDLRQRAAEAQPGGLA